MLTQFFKEFPPADCGYRETDAVEGTVLAPPALLPPSRFVVVALLVTLAAAVRLDRLGAVGFSEDEINKVRAVRAYRQHDFSANAEHPMLMKLADWASISFAPPGVSPEAALRLPNAIVGSATTAVAFLLAQALFDTTVGLWAAAFWALDVNAASINRIGKEDTFLLFFLLLAAYCYERAKATTAGSGPRDRWYNWSGASFGLMLASKYMPHYFGLHALFNVAADRNPADKTPDKRPAFFAAMGGAFVVANFTLVLPATWRYVQSYIHGDTLRHSGYQFAHELYVNSIEATPWGVPPWPAIGPDVTGGDVSGFGGHVNKIPAQLCYERTSKTNGILNFNATNCYSNIAGPAAPTNLRILP